MTILVGFDGSPESSAALDEAIDEARARGVALHVVTCLTHEGGDSPTRVRSELDAAQQAQQQLDALAERITASGVDTTTELHHVLAGGVATALVDEAERIDARMIVLGLEPRSRVAKAVLGSVVRDVLTAASCPVMTVRAPDTDD